MSKLAQLRAQRDAAAKKAQDLNNKYPANQRMPVAEAGELDAMLAEVEAIANARHTVPADIRLRIRYGDEGRFDYSTGSRRPRRHRRNIATVILAGTMPGRTCVRRGPRQCVHGAGAGDVWHDAGRVARHWRDRAQEGELSSIGERTGAACAYRTRIRRFQRKASHCAGLFALRNDESAPANADDEKKMFFCYCS
ncbi:hypothetical protein [Pseudoduganella plicata]|uniref:hypothetical protein n=1 Tax=Pseudoduganella plicata TaxID=321984 RepID=UPI0026A249A7